MGDKSAKMPPFRRRSTKQILATAIAVCLCTSAWAQDGHKSASQPNTLTSQETIIPGQWNTLEATANGDHFVIIYNGRQVVDTHDSKRAAGAIGLQLAHPEDAREATIEFRNLKVRRLGK
jgi:prolyl-tRNA editing enzyme YbaK/EbsC (Cys-tRNA(Pro) deacylase)